MKNRKKILYFSSFSSLSRHFFTTTYGRDISLIIFTFIHVFFSLFFSLTVCVCVCQCVCMRERHEYKHCETKDTFRKTSHYTRSTDNTHAVGSIRYLLQCRIKRTMCVRVFELGLVGLPTCITMCACVCV